MKSPEETADAVIAQLGLNEKDQERARALYASLLVSLNKADLAPTATGKPMLTEAAKSFGDEFRLRMQNLSHQRLAVNQGVDRLNQKFWMKPTGDGMTPTGLNGLANPDSQALARMMVDDTNVVDAAALAPQQELGAVPGKQLEIPPHLRGQLEQNATPAMIAALAAKLAQAKAAQQGGQAEASDDASADSTDHADKGATALENLLKRAEAPTSGGLGALALATPEGAAHSQAEFGQSSHQHEGEMAKNLAQHTAKSAEKLVQKSDFKDALKSLEGLNPQMLNAKPEALAVDAGAGAAAGAAATKAPTSGENETNIRQLMNQAQYLIKKGGGEVKVQMSPEGMGPIHLKVALQDGKVNVQMSATTDEAKKTIESSLADLKTSLAAHKLSVDHVKVDVVNNTSTDTATQNQMNNHAGRDNARQFWNQFNDNFGSQSQRDGFVDMVPLKGYAQPKRDPLQPIETASRSRSVEGKGQGLNLVA
jgi:flagellar hook-length control protein FliK